MEEAWNRIHDVLGEKIGREAVDTWFQLARFGGVEDHHATVMLPNKFYVEWIQGHYYQDLLASLRSVYEDVSEVRLRVGETRQGELFTKSPKSAPAAEKAVASAPRQTLRMGSLIPRYNFSTFVVGNGNQFAHAAAQAVANRPGEQYNPLFIYGRVGLGKTHLINAIGHHVLRRNPEARVGYLSAERFMNELITAIRKNRTDDFKKRFRKLDVLILDDVHFLAGREQTQEEFFHTFNVLYENHHQIVLTSDQFPKDIPDLEDRLRNRFEWGLIADIQPPDMETRVAIIQKKSEAERLRIPHDVALFLASKFDANIRELEGSLTRLGAYASLVGRPINLEMAREVLKTLVRSTKVRASIELVQKVVADEFGIHLRDMASASRTKSIALARQVAMSLARSLADESFSAIGEKFGKRDHSTVMHACDKVEKLRLAEPEFDQRLERLERLVEEEARG